MFTQITGRLLIFIGKKSGQILEEAQKFQNRTVEELWDVTYKINIFNHTSWKYNVTNILKKFQDQIVQQAQKGDVNNLQQWSFPGAFLYSLTVITTIGK